jgi:PD-(D/E)XK endonuclease
LELKLKKQPKKSASQRPPFAPFTRGEQTCKQRGELAEIAFLHKAAAFGFGVAKPYGDSERYDFILDSGERLWRVQVKSISTTYTFGGGHGYRTATCHSRGSCKDLPYTANEIDFFVAYIVPRDIWYVIPVELVTAVLGICFYPSGCRMGGYYEPYREAWHLMAPGADLKPQPPIPIRVPPIGRPRKDFVRRQGNAKRKK